MLFPQTACPTPSFNLVQDDLRRPYLPLRCLECPMAWRPRKDRPWGKQTCLLENHLDVAGGGKKHWNQAHCFLCPPNGLAGFTTTRENALTHYRKEHREGWPFYLIGPMIAATKIEEEEKIGKLINQHCKARADPNVVNWQQPVEPEDKCCMNL